MKRNNHDGPNLRVLAGVLAVAAVALCWSPLSRAFGVTGAAASANPVAGQPDAARHGEELFGRICQQCHNTRGHGGKCPQLVRGAWAPGGANSDQLMFNTITHGRPGTQMGAFGEVLTKEQIWQIITFLREEAVRVKAADAKKPKDDEADLWY
ncbi:c-type cytochrome [Nitrogeniibacter mangrovi]|uniref:C-type cytochrome n=1 Tax=Nitrogeniibacter mangrovi TaxID=2016596 RepID=A0A6C1AZZ8_9RHOO|nr:c-type cytochrome [Nitrogeniibacter mangrovi]QID16936.1 c-type cytochrome [Nitrogeniibacter mangrovi]